MTSRASPGRTALRAWRAVAIFSSGNGGVERRGRIGYRVPPPHTITSEWNARRGASSDRGAAIDLQPIEAAIFPPIDRRRFLQITAGVAASAPSLARLARRLRGEGSFTFAFFTDTHVSINRNVEECRALVREIAAFAPDLAVNGGDVTEWGWRGEYETYKGVVAGLPYPIHHVPGNHDVRWSPLGMQVFRRALGEPHRSFDHGGVHFVLLDSSVPLSHWGHYESAQLRWLEADLRRVGRETPVLVFTHHWVGRDRVMVDNENELLRVLEPYNVKAVFNGHGHSDLLWRWDGVACTMCKGLYQGSYLRVDVDRAAGEIRLSRRTTEQPAPRPLVSVPLRADRARRPVWTVPASLTISASVRGGIAGATEARWDEGAWAPVPATGVATTGLVPGTHLLSLRTRDGGPQRAFAVRLVPSRPRLVEAWSRKLTGGVMSHLRLASGVLYASAMDGTLTAIQTSDGHVRWSARTGGYCHSSPAVEGTKVVVGSADGSVYAFSARYGRPLWRFATRGPVYASAAIAKGVVAIASGDGTVYGLELETGRERWRFALPPGDTAFAQSPAATDGDRFYVGAWDRHLYALDAVTGREAWRRRCTERTFAYSPAIGGPAVGGGRVYVPSNDNVLHALDAATGEPAWSFTSPGDKVGYSSPALVGDRLYVGCLGPKGEARCVSAADGRELWVAATGAEIYDSSPAVAAGRVSIGSVNGTLSVMDAATGQIVAQHRLPPGHFLASPAAEGTSIYAASFSDTVTAFRMG